MSVVTSAARDATKHEHLPEDHHRDLSGGWARAAVFGVSDGLLTNVAIVLGVAGANPGAGLVRLAGLASLMGGAFSMAAGEYVSMSAQKELIGREIDVERRALRDYPEQERRELVAIYVKRGVERKLAEQVAEQLMRDPETALETHSREELGVNPNSLGSPGAAALASFASFAVGALLPLLPWFFFSASPAVLASVVIGALSALVIGWVLGMATGRSSARTAARQLAIAVLAAGVTYGVGVLFGAQVAVS